MDIFSLFFMQIDQMLLSAFLKLHLTLVAIKNFTNKIILTLIPSFEVAILGCLVLHFG